jgi:hypothetical protein
MRTVTLVILSVLLAFAPEVRCQSVRGAFAILHDRPTYEELKQARDDGLNLVILQYTQGTCGLPEVDATKAFIAAAESAGIDYLIGLRFHDTWDEVWEAHPDSLTALVESSLALVDTFRASVGPHFKGWYMALEVANAYTPAQYDALATAFASFGTVAEPIAMGFYFNPRVPPNLDPDTFARQVQKIIAPFDVVLLQDGVGERLIEPRNFATELAPYYRAVKSVVVADPRRQFWAIVEGFRCTTGFDPVNRWCLGDRSPAPPDTIREQVAAACAVTPHVIAYDLGEFLEPVVAGNKHDAYRAFTAAVKHPPCPPI